MKYVTYIDEAGNTGEDIVNKSQPFFVMSAIMLPSSEITSILDILKHGFQQAKEKEETEIKGAHWCKGGKKKQNAIRNIIKAVQEHNGKIIATALEKRYMIAGKLIQTFFDGVDNHTQCDLWIYDKKIALYSANKIYNELDDPTIENIGKLLNAPSEENFKKIIHKLKQIFKEPLEEMMLDASEKFAGEIAELYKPDGSMFNKSVEHSPNLTVFNTICEMIASQCNREQSNTDLVFDNCNLCNGSFAKWVELGKSRKRDLTLPSWNAKIYSWKNRIDNYVHADSKKDNLLQIADIVSSCINHALISYMNGKSSKFDDEIITFACQLIQKGFLWYAMSNTSLKRVFNLS